MSRSKRAEETEMQLEVVEGATLLSQLVAEISSDPASAVELVKILGRVTKPWQALEVKNQMLNEITVPQGMSAQEYKLQSTGLHVAGYRMETIFGDEVAVILRESPKWRVLICGQVQANTPFIAAKAGKKSEIEVQEFAEKKLRELGYILG